MSYQVARMRKIAAIVKARGITVTEVSGWTPGAGRRRGIAPVTGAVGPRTWYTLWDRPRPGG